MKKKKIFSAIRNRWLNEGAQWFDNEDDIHPPKPKDWSIEAAIKQVEKIDSTI